MEHAVIIGMDYGTSGAKALAYDGRERKIIASAYREYPMLVPRPNYAEHNPEDWWDVFCQIMEELKVEGGIQKEQIQAISISCHTPTLTPVDEMGVPLCNGIIWADARAEKECEEIIERYGDEIAQVNPAQIRPYHIVSKLLWMKRHRPRIWEQAWAFLDNNSFINYRLTGKLALDRSLAANYHFYNVHTQEWDPRAAELLGADLSKFPPVCNCQDIVGKVTAKAAAQTGLSEHTMVVAGMSDVTAAVLGMGVCTADRLCYSCGTGSHMVLLAKATSGKERFTTDPRLITLGYSTPEYMVNIGVISNTGGAMKWMRNALCQEEAACSRALGRDVYEIMSEEAQEASPGCGGVIFLPYVAGELCPLYNPNARGNFFGISTVTDKPAMIRAVMEGTSYSARQVMELVLSTGKDKKKSDLQEMVVTGGPTKSSLWMQILCDILGIPIVTLKKADGGPVGNLILAGCAVGFFQSQEEGTRQFARVHRKFYPQKEQGVLYECGYRKFLELQRAVIPCWDTQ
jgi:xylulokinase